MRPVVVAKLKNKNEANLILQLVTRIGGEAKILKGEELEDFNFSLLLKEGRKSKTLSSVQTKKELKKRGINI